MRVHRLLFIFSALMYSEATKPSSVQSLKFKTNETINKIDLNKSMSSNNTIKTIKAKSSININFPKVRPNITRVTIKMITPEMIADWSLQMSKKLIVHEEKVVRRKEILKSFTNVKLEIRNGTQIIERVARTLEDLLIRRATAAEDIMRKAEDLVQNAKEPPTSYTFASSKGLNDIKPTEEEPKTIYEKPMNCTSLNREKLKTSKHFDADVSLNATSVHVSAEVFACDPKVLGSIYYSEELLQTFRNNYAQDSMIGFQYFCSAKGFLRHYPAASWESMIKLNLDDENLADVYDCRLRSWYVSAGGAPRDILILLDATGSMRNSSNSVVATTFISVLLNALTDDDRVNVLRYNIVVKVESPVSCFNDKLVPANHVNTAAMMDAMKGYNARNETRMDEVLNYAVRFLQKEKGTADHPASCQQAIVLLTDTLYYNYTELMKQLDPEGKIRIFVMWLHDSLGLRDDTRECAKTLSCSQDGYFAELITDSDVTLQVMQILRVLERPLVAQRKHRLKVFSDVYAHIEDPRKGEYHWLQKENTEQRNRYRELRKNKDALLNSTQLTKDYMHQVGFEEYGQYYEGEDVKYRMLISVSVPVFEHTTVENITIQLDEEKLRNATRTYPVNRLLGVAGIDIPVDHLKIILPYYELGPGGSLFLVDHRGGIVFHDNMKPTFDGDILKPGYRTVDFLDLEQAGVDHMPRHYPTDWFNFRRTVILDQPKGTKTLYGKNIFDNGMRAYLEHREYHWRRINNHYTVFVVLPPYARHHAVPESVLTQKLADDALKALDQTDFTVHPDWLYCRHVEQYFDSRTDEVEHFLRRRREEPNFMMEQLKHAFYPIPPTLLERTYKCDEKLMSRFCYDAIATEQWAREHEQPDIRDCKYCPIGSTTAFFATESGLTRWQLYHAVSGRADPPEGSAWPRGPDESWYRRAAAAPATLIIHAPTYPITRMRIVNTSPKPIGARAQWFTAARTIGIQGKGNLGVAGFHFHPSHLEDMLENTVNFPCQEEDKDKCKATCDGKIWACVLIDDAGWIIAGEKQLDDYYYEGVRQHLATIYPGVMAAFLNASVFKLHWIHDYQSICFPPKKEPLPQESCAQTLTSSLVSLTKNIILLIEFTSNALSVLWLLLTTHSVNADTSLERTKRRKRLKKDLEREKFDTLFDPRVLVNRTKFAACDRSRAIYKLQRTPLATEALKRPAEVDSSCAWPFVASPVEQTNLIMIAVYTACPYKGRTIPDPVRNNLVDMNDDDDPHPRAASRLACWRNRVHLPGRPPTSTCFPHEYEAEEGYRQCDEWIADPEPEDDSTLNCKSQPYIVLLLLILIIFVI